MLPPLQFQIIEGYLLRCVAVVAVRGCLFIVRVIEVRLFFVIRRMSLRSPAPEKAGRTMHGLRIVLLQHFVLVVRGLLVLLHLLALVRLILGNIAKRAKNIEDFLQNQLPYVMDIQARYMDERIRFIVEESGFFENNFLAKEGLIRRDLFSAMFGLVGLADAVDILLEKEGHPEWRFGRDDEATKLGVRIMDVIKDFNDHHFNPYCEATGGHFLLHAQVGIASDVNVTPGTRIPIGEEPANLVDQLMILSNFHHYFPSGTGDIFPIDMTVHKNPDYVLDIIKGSFRQNLRYLSFYASDSDVIRVTGYLVKKSEIEKLEQGQNVKHDTTALGLGAKQNGHIMERKVR